jgi:hypothetical protein
MLLLGVNPARRLLDTIAGRLLAGVDVRIVISTPGAAVSAEESYSTTTSLSQTADAVLTRTRLVAGDAARARRAFSGVWPNAPAQFNKIANHSKLGMIDNCAVWVGSHNLYPFWLSGYSFLIENRRVAQTSATPTASGAGRRGAGRYPVVRARAEQGIPSDILSRSNPRPVPVPRRGDRDRRRWPRWRPARPRRPA